MVSSDAQPRRGAACRQTVALPLTAVVTPNHNIDCGENLQNGKIFEALFINHMINMFLSTFKDFPKIPMATPGIASNPQSAVCSEFSVSVPEFVSTPPDTFLVSAS